MFHRKDRKVCAYHAGLKDDVLLNVQIKWSQNHPDCRDTTIPD